MTRRDPDATDAANDVATRLSTVLIGEIRLHGPRVALSVATTVVVSTAVAVRRFVERPDVSPEARTALMERLVECRDDLTRVIEATSAESALREQQIRADINVDLNAGTVRRTKVHG